MLKSDQKSKPSDREPCWTREVSTGVRFDLADGDCLMLPYSHLSSAYLRSGSSTQVLELEFTTYRVRLSGHHLRSILIAIQKYAVESARALSNTERMSRADGLSWITSIEIDEKQSDGSADD